MTKSSRAKPDAVVVTPPFSPNGPATPRADTRKRKPSAERREELLDIASVLFDRDGFQNVGMRDIAAEADIRAASIYNHFSSKDEVLEGILARVDRDLIMQNLPLLDAPGSYADRLRELLRAQILQWTNRYAWNILAREGRVRFPDRFQEVDAFRGEYQRRLSDFIRAGVRAGEFHTDDATIVTIAMLDMVNGVHQWFRDGGKYSIGQVADHYLELMVDRWLQVIPSDPRGSHPPRTPARKAAARAQSRANAPTTASARGGSKSPSKRTKPRA